MLKMPKINFLFFIPTPFSNKNAMVYYNWTLTLFTKMRNLNIILNLLKSLKEINLIDEHFMEKVGVIDNVYKI